MEKSENYYKRQQYMQNLKIPTFTEIRNVLGKELGDAVINECPEELKHELGTEPKLNGAGDTLWTSPSDLLQGIVVLKPPFTNRYIKALTHEGILYIGALIEEKFRNEMEEKCKHALADQEVMLVFIAEQERIKAVRDALAERKKDYEEKFESFENDFENRLEEELKLLTLRLLEDNQQVLEAQREEIGNEWRETMEAEIEEITSNLTVKFLNKLYDQEAELTSKYTLDLKKIEAVHENTLELEQAICKETLKQLKHNLECKNISNLIYVLCMERRKCECDRLEIEKQHNDIVSKLSKQVDSSSSEIKSLQNSLSLAKEKIIIKERCLQEILKQFQKFVYFALKAAPKQGEFLLNIEKLLLYELTETVANLSKKSAGSPVFIPKRLPPKQKEKIPRNLTLPPDHNCLDELDIPEESSEELFSVILNDKLYVREDFRNMISQGIDISPTNELWNKDVEQLTLRLKTPAEDTTLGRQAKQNSKTQLTDMVLSTIATIPDQNNSIMNKADTKMHYQYPDYTEFSGPHDQTSRRSSVHFVDANVHYPQLDHIDIVEADFPDTQFQEQENLTECILNTDEGDADTSAQVCALKANNSFLLCAKDSLEHHRTSLRLGSLRDDNIEGLGATGSNTHFTSFEKTLQEGSKTSRFLEKIRKINEEGQEGKKNVVEVKQSIDRMFSNILVEQNLLNPDEIMQKEPNKKAKNTKPQHSITPKDRRYSGLSLAQDSLEMIKSKTIIKTEEKKKIIEETFNKAIMEEKTPDKVNDAETLSSSSTIMNSRKDVISINETVIEIEQPIYTEYSTNPTEEQPLVFKPLPKIYHTGSIIVNPDQTWRVYEHYHKEDQNIDKSTTASVKRDSTAQTQRDNFLEKENIAEITGNVQEIKTCTTEFTVDRVHSLIGMLKQDPSLMRIFTACSR